MSQKAIRKAYYTTSELASVVGRIGEFSVDITKFTIVVYDGVTAGGIPLALADHTHDVASGAQDGFMASSDYTYLYSHTHPNATISVAGFMSAADKLKLDGINGGGGTPIPYTPNSTGDTIVSRDVNADFAARYITATKFIGALQGNADTATDGVVTTGSYSNPSWIVTLAGSKVTAIPDSSIAAVAWSKLTGTAPNISTFPNNSGYINGAGNTTGTSGGVLSLGGRETSSPTARTVIIRDASGRAQVANPSASADIATKQYVDANAGFIATRPVTAVTSLSLPSGSISHTILNVTEQGIIWAIGFKINLYATIDNYTTLNLNITIDGTTTMTAALGDFMIFGSVSPGGYRLPLNIGYKQTCLITLTGSLSSAPPGVATITALRYVVLA